MTADNSQKTPLGRSLNEFAKRKVLDHMQLTGQNLPCSVVKAVGAIITVKFEVNSPFTLPEVTLPLFGPEYIRYPMQEGDKGVVLAMDARIGAMSGLGGTAVADLSKPANLSALVFLPIGNTEWANVDPRAVVVRGPNGVVLEDEGSNSVFTLTPTSVTIQAPNSITLKCGTSEIILTPTSYLLKGTTGEITDGVNATSATIMSQVWSLMVTFLNTHVHLNGNGGGNTGVAATPYTGGNISPGV